MTAACDTVAGEKCKTGTSKSMNSDSDTEINAPIIPTKKHRSENRNAGKGKDQEPTVNTSQSAKEDTDHCSEPESGSRLDVTIPLKQCMLPLENSNSRSTQSSHSHGSNKVDVDTLTGRLPVAEAIQGLKHAATQLKEVPKARVSFASA